MSLGADALAKASGALHAPTNKAARPVLRHEKFITELLFNGEVVSGIRPSYGYFLTAASLEARMFEHKRRGVNATIVAADTSASRLNFFQMCSGGTI
jgi:hypothetical protein